MNRKMPWIVKIIKPPVPYHYGKDYFPRKFYYKKDAVQLRDSVNANSGQAVVEPIRKQT